MLKKLLEPFIVLLDNTVARWKVPFIKRKITQDHINRVINHYIFKRNAGIYVGFVRSNWTGSTLLIRMAQWLRSGAPRVWSRFTHVFILVKDENENLYTIEAVDEGVVVRTLKDSLSGRDDLVIKKINRKKFSLGMATEFEKYIEYKVEKDRVQNIPYDEKHRLLNPDKVDCSELIYHGLVKVGLKNEINTVTRAGEISWSPLEVYESDLFEVDYEL